MGPSNTNQSFREFLFAVPIAVLFLILLYWLQQSGLVQIENTSESKYITAFLVGLIASISSCMAVVGGLILSMSSVFSQTGDRIRPQILFHGGRLLSFFFFGGMIGVVGSAFTLGIQSTFILNTIIGIVMLVLGLKLLNVFRFVRKLQPTLPSVFSKHIQQLTTFNHTITPLFVGVATFFLPCGFTQSMQIFTLSTETFVAGGFTMLSYALGTLPVLAILSFSPTAAVHSSYRDVFFKVAGLIVIAFALLNIINGLVVMGVLDPIFSL